ncbi:hypothetical protein [Amphiplicatus metriothermophilus]|uniref:hypothetical protein n=1 Tax=Amphiplicatus metriothermophilus TaxID=1519374 RepID=UPI00135CB645|nr:hypothetical protein [Amphiplicatus metriothermophilus]MBB5520153.1 uncharacterized protein YneF (UPF0154 family) [Amphiplicatus metriothermophilus]
MAADALMFVALLLASVAAMIAIAIVAPLALAVSALIGVFLKQRRPSRWRAAQPA